MIIKEYKKHREDSMEKEKSEEEWIAWNDRYIETYTRIVGNRFTGPILDVGSGTNDLVKACRKRGFEAEGIDVDRANFEQDKLPYPDNKFKVVIMNALIEHIKNPDNLLKELARVVKSFGIIILRTPNWRMDFRNFYKDPTHVKPYVPEGLETLVGMYGFRTFFNGPGLIGKPSFYWKIPGRLKWWVAKYIPGGTRSIILIAENKK